MNRLYTEAQNYEAATKPSLFELMAHGISSIQHGVIALCTLIASCYQVGAHLISATVQNIKLMGQCVLHYTYYNQGSGYVHIGVRYDAADGRLFIRGHGTRDIHNRSTALDAVYIQVENRYLARMARPSARVMLGIISQAKLEGYRVHSIEWNGRQMSPFDGLVELEAKLYAERAHAPCK